MRLFWLMFFLLPWRLMAQTLPVDAVTGKIYYAEEVLVKDGSQTELYNRAKAWFTSTGDKSTILQTDDFANGILIGSNYAPVVVKNGNIEQVFKLWYTIKLEMEDDRYWYSIYDLQVQTNSPPSLPDANEKNITKQPLETFISQKPTHGLKSSEKPFTKSLQNATQQTISTLIDDLKSKML